MKLSRVPFRQGYMRIMRNGPSFAKEFRVPEGFSVNHCSSGPSGSSKVVRKQDTPEGDDFWTLPNI
jgi:hypothetical protein